MLLKIDSDTRNRSVKRPLQLNLKRLWWLSPLIAVSAWVGYKQVQSYFAQPQAIVVLGGHADRERFAAKLAAENSNLPILVSSGSPRNYAQRIFAKAGVKSDRLHLDYRAKDTVTNFTTLVQDLKAQGINTVYLVTSENHMTRSLIIGEIVFGSQGIVIKPMSVPCDAPSESMDKSLRDGARAILWLLTGKTGETLIKR